MSAPTVVIMAGGQGSRMHSATPKVLHPVCGRPMIEWVIAAAREAQAGRIVVVDSPDRLLEGHLPEGVEVAIQAVPRGTADAVLSAAGQWGEETVVVLSADVPLITAEAIQGLIATHEARGAKATMLTMELDEPGSLGRVVREAGTGNVVRVAEVKAAGDARPADLLIREVNAGIYAFDGGLLEAILRRVGTDNAQGEAYLPDALFILAHDGHTIATHTADDPALVLGVNDRLDLARVERHARIRINEDHMRRGVTIVDPAATYIDVTVAIGADTRIEPGTTLKGATRIGRRCTVRESYVIDAVIEDDVSVGPFASLRPGTVLHSGSKAGTFVEIKNSDIGEGTKVPHLSYVGDADIGPQGNLGASTITANYDGHSKHRTVIGARVSTSVDTTLVAPIFLGDDVRTGAGSVITDDLPDGSLGIGRPRQTTIEGYAERRRERDA